MLVFQGCIFSILFQQSDDSHTSPLYVASLQVYESYTSLFDDWAMRRKNDADVTLLG